MPTPLDDLVRHNAWANQQVITCCRGLGEATLNAPLPGTYGPIIDTLRHSIDSEMSYLARLLAVEPTYLWPRGEAVGIAVLAERVAVLATAWEHFLASGVDLERRMTAYGDDPKVYTVPIGVVLAQAIHHGSEHRAQICTILGALGHQPPDVSAWGYGFASGRSVIEEYE